ncbi:ABC transporter ATP-binding protein [Gemella sp. GH3]|uniref:ABC transporter ATP-binding protein n=1 Tax=unclassified Gemella TaxID=2624949 RepID=UPI0015D0CD8D|nr:MULTISPECIES: ABC transporter ATP-binding protein [unclassified Gemella]MBF0713966.1 ABC transporter ATP-binding protein [Gemella sp. GH3.1]NYS50918.1 ABC transporter ATP-binding protein [Gemella sp. GH3]
MDKIIKIENLSFDYLGNQVFKDLNLCIEKGKITTIIGKNGCGKSTLLSILAGINKVKKKTVIIDDRDLNDYTKKELAQKISIVYQNNIAPEELTVNDLISYGRLPYQKTLFSKFSDRDFLMINHAINVTNLGNLKDIYVSKLSGGQKQRVFLALAIAQDTDVLILDEPTSYLDIKYQKSLLDLILILNRKYNKTIVMVLHDINQAISYSDKIIAIKDGNIFKTGNSKEFCNKDILRELYDTNIEIINNIIKTW